MKGPVKGFSLVESMLVVAVGAVLLGLAVPSFRGLIQYSRRNGAAEQIAGDLRKARSRAITTGWQYRLYGFNSGEDSPFKNQYRLLARRSSAVGWPDATADPMQSATQMAGAWIDIQSLYPSVSLNADDATADFWVDFDSRGVRFNVDPSFDPLVVTDQLGHETSVTVSAVGSVEIQ